MNSHENSPRECVATLRLRIPFDFAQPGGPGEDIEDGFALLAEDDRGAIVRLDRHVTSNASVASGSVLYTTRRNGALLAIRIASETDRLRRFRRPQHIDRLEVNCCGHACRYLSIYDHGSGRFFDLDIQPIAARACAAGPLSHLFVCQRCGRQHASDL